MELFFDLYGFLSVVLKAGSLAFRSALIGSVLTVLLVTAPLARVLPEAQAARLGGIGHLAIRGAGWGTIFFTAASAALGLVALVGTLDVEPRAALGAGFVLSAGGHRAGRGRADGLRAARGVRRRSWLGDGGAGDPRARGGGCGQPRHGAAGRAHDAAAGDGLAPARRGALAGWAAGAAAGAARRLARLRRAGHRRALFGAGGGRGRADRAGRAGLLAGLHPGARGPLRHRIWRDGGNEGLAVPVPAGARRRQPPPAAPLRPRGAGIAWLPRLRRFVECEIIAGIAVFGIAASLTSVPPSVDLPDDRASWAEVAERFTPAWPRFASPSRQTSASRPCRRGSTPSGRAPGHAAPAGLHPGEGFLPPRNAFDLAWSEYNHHVAGAIVLLVGLAACWTARGAPWARHWPCSICCWRCSSSCAPTRGLAAGRDRPARFAARPEVLQHKLLAFLVVGFAVSEWLVRLRGRGGAAAYVFPLAMVLGGFLLLTHTHAIGNVRRRCWSSCRTCRSACWPWLRAARDGWSCAGTTRPSRAGEAGCGRAAWC
jgi:putative copper resistance protein D